MSMMSFELWYAVNIDDLNCEMAETGMDRELDFNEEEWMNDQYDDYVDECNARIAKL